MVIPFLLPWRHRAAGPQGRPRHRFLPRLETLEDRAVPALLTVTTSADSGVGSLRQAIIDANTAPDLDTIVFAKSVTSITLTTGELAITEDLIVAGPGAKKLTVSGNDASRVFNIQSGNVGIGGLTITKGLADENAPDLKSFGGGILNQGSLHLVGVTMSNNKAVGDAATLVVLPILYEFQGAGLGGGISNFGSLIVTGSKFVGNQALGADAAVGGPFAFAGAAVGGAIHNFATAHVSASQFTGNLAQAGDGGVGGFAANASGGAIYNDQALTVVGSSFSGNKAIGGDGSTSPNHNGHALGGGIASGSLLALAMAGSATLNVQQSTFAFNVAQGGNANTATDVTVSQADGPGNGFGGGICVYQGTAIISQSRLHHNEARGGTGGAPKNGSLGIGGGVFFFNFIGAVTADVDDSRIDHNKAVGGAVGGNGLGGGLAAATLDALFGAAGTVTVTGTKLDNNLAQGGIGGGIFNQGDLTLVNVVVSSNKAVGDAVTADLFPTSPLPSLYAFTGGGLGGGLANFGTLTVTGSKFTGNLAQSADGSVGLPAPPPVGTSFAGMALGGSLFNFASATIYSSQFSSSTAKGGNLCVGSFAGLGGGGAIYNDADLTIFTSTFTKNQAVGGNGGTGFNHVGDGIGGAIVSGSLKGLIPAGTGTLVVRQSTFAQNQARGGNDTSVGTPNPDNRPGDGYGGAIFLYQGSASINRTRVHHNQAIGGTAGGDQGGSMGIGGGIFFFNYAGGITATVSNSRIDHNSALGGLGRAGRPGGDALGGGIANTGLGGSFALAGTITIVNTAVDNNVAQGGNGGTGADGGDGLGGGLFGGTDATLLVNGSSITKNKALKGLKKPGGTDGDGIGGGVYSLGTFTPDALTVIVLNQASTSNNNVFP